MGGITILVKILRACSQLTSSEVDGSPAEPLDGPGVVVDDVLLALGVTPPITRYGRQFAAPSTAGNIHCANHKQSSAEEEWQHKSLSKLFSLEKKYVNKSLVSPELVYKVGRVALS